MNEMNVELKEGSKVLLAQNFGSHPRGLKGQVSKVEYDEYAQVKNLYIMWNGIHREEMFYIEEDAPNIIDSLQIVLD